MDFLENKFAIKRVAKSTDEDYIMSLKIYNETTPNNIKTDTNEITIWLNRKEPNNAFELLLFILYLDEKIVGFAMMSYIKRTRIVIIDYIALYDYYRINAIYFPYISLLQNYLYENNFDVTYIINEVSNKDNGENIDKESRLLKKIFCLEGFAKIEAKYYTPPLGTKNHESSFEAFLYIKSNDELNKISKSTYIDIISSIYYDYFLTWYEAIFLDPARSCEYKHKLDSYYETIVDSIQEIQSFEIKYSHCPVIDSSYAEEVTYGILPTIKKNKKLHTIPIICAVLLICPILIIWLYQYILEFIGIQIGSVNSIIGSFLGATITALSAFFFTRKKL
jgi:hypothetical protein